MSLLKCHHEFYPYKQIYQIILKTFQSQSSLIHVSDENSVLSDIMSTTLLKIQSFMPKFLIHRNYDIIKHVVFIC